MPTFQIGLEDGRKLRIEAESQEAALAGVQHFLGNSAPPSTPDAPVTATGLAQAAATGAGTDVATTMLGLPGDMARGVDWLFDKFGPATTPEARAKLEELRSGPTGMPTSASLSKKAEDLGLVHPSENKWEERVRNVSSFIPLALGGPEAILANSIKRGVVPGVASQAAGEAGDALDPSGTLGTVGRVAGAFVQKGPKAVLDAPTDAVLRAEGGAGSQAVRDLNYGTDGRISSTFINRTLNDLDKRNLNAATAPETTAILNDYRNRGVMTAKDYDELKLRLNNASDNAAPAAREALYDHVNSLTPGMAAFGDPAVFRGLWNDARGNYAAGMRGKDIEDRIQNALDNAARSNSGMNIGNDIRGTLKPLAKNRNEAARQSGFNADEIAALRKITEGTFGSNVLRRVSNYLGGGGGLGATHLAGVGGLVGGAAGGGYEGAGEGALGGLGLALLGHLARSRYNSMQVARAHALSNMVRARSPLGRATMPAVGPSVSPGVQRILNMAHALQIAHGN